MHMTHAIHPTGHTLPAPIKSRPVIGWAFPKLKATAILLAVFAAPAHAAEVNLCWRGAGGYTMTGRMSLPDAAMFKTILTEADVTRFKISGYYKGKLIGTWDSATRAADDTWHLRFDPAGMAFLTGGRFASFASQGWNADGNVTNCGNPGFGFNSGDFSQDLCINGTYIAASSIAPDTPLIATFDAVTPDCRNTAAVSKRIRAISGKTAQMR